MNTWLAGQGVPTTGQARQGVLVLMLATLLMWGGFFMVVPLIGVHFVDGLGWAATTVGVALGLRQFTQQFGTLFGGMLADRHATKRLILLGLALRVLGFVALSQANSVAALMLSLVLSSIGGAFFESPSLAALTALTAPNQHQKIFALRGTIGNLGMGLGVLAGGALVTQSFALVALVAASCYLVVILFAAPLLPEVRVASGVGGPIAGLRLVLHDTRFMRFTALMTGFFLLWSQVSLSVTLEAKRLAGNPSAVAWVFLVNTVVSVLVQMPLTRWATQTLQPMQALRLGVGVMAAAFASIAWAQNIWMLFFSVACFACGTVLAAPQQQTITAQLANKNALGSYFGFGALALAVGGGAGNILAGWLYDYSRVQHWPMLPWLLVASVGFASVYGLWRSEKHLLRDQI